MEPYPISVECMRCVCRIYLNEHRNYGGSRRVTVTIQGTKRRLSAFVGMLAMETFLFRCQLASGCAEEPTLARYEQTWCGLARRQHCGISTRNKRIDFNTPLKAEWTSLARFALH
eukprot:364362-Chlamydomonas_euryale.AAC.22